MNNIRNGSNKINIFCKCFMIFSDYKIIEGGPHAAHSPLVNHS